MNYPFGTPPSATYTFPDLLLDDDILELSSPPQLDDNDDFFAYSGESGLPPSVWNIDAAAAIQDVHGASAYAEHRATVAEQAAVVAARIALDAQTWFLQTGDHNTLSSVTAQQIADEAVRAAVEAERVAIEARRIAAAARDGAMRSAVIAATLAAHAAGY
jgi:hypothetical protein